MGGAVGGKTPIFKINTKDTQTNVAYLVLLGGVPLWVELEEAGHLVD